MRRDLRLIVAVLLLIPLYARAQSRPATTQARLMPAWPVLMRAVNQTDDWYKSDRGQQIADNIASWQNANGGWWKVYDPSIPRPEGLLPPRLDDGPEGDNEQVWRRTSTFDNNATYTEMRILARSYRVAHKDAERIAFERGLKFIFDSQYPNGGWPQRFPLEDNYGRHITFNDNAMTGVMLLLRDIAEPRPDFAFVDEATRKQCREAFARGVECILNCQIKIGGKLTAWCQQHDEKTFAPAQARAYELPSITASESSGIVLMLMQIAEPGDRIRQSIEAACDWYEAVKITGKRVQTIRTPQGNDKALVNDADAGPLWGRYYDLETMKPFVCDRDGVKKDSMKDISFERRRGYAWYGNWGTRVLNEKQEWLKKVNRHS